jgi:TnpA family transposase
LGFTQVFKTLATREALPREVLQRRLLLCLYGLGTNAGLKRMAASNREVGYADLLYVRRRFVDTAALREAIRRVVDATLSIRLAHIWGEGTAACASDSKKFGAWDQNLMTEWHVRYGGRGVMIYWHVERRAACIYSQLKRCSSSEVAAMIEGVLRHCTDLEVQRNYVDSHGQSHVAFAFSYLLGFELMPRLKDIAAQKLHRPEAGRPADYPNLQPILARPIDWETIRPQYDEMIKLKFHKNPQATMRSSADSKEFCRALRGMGKTLSKFWLMASSVKLRRTSEKAKWRRPATAWRRFGLFSSWSAKIQVSVAAIMQKCK